jgi:hypothetical protein
LEVAFGAEKQIEGVHCGCVGGAEIATIAEKNA